MKQGDDLDDFPIDDLVVLSDEEDDAFENGVLSARGGGEDDGDRLNPQPTANTATEKKRKRREKEKERKARIPSRDNLRARCAADIESICTIRSESW
jgi:protein CMS1